MIELVRGMRDMLPGDYALQAAIAENIEQVLASYGYVSVDAPILERRELYLRKLGEELVGKIYEFSFNGRDLALRPEWTASVLRSYVARMQAEPLPLRLRYTGPVFRNERPQRHTFRQFTQLGVELIGGPTPRADAECLALACAGLDAVNVQDYRVRIGHIGLIRELLNTLGLSDRTQSFLAWSLERMRKNGAADIRAQLEASQGEHSIIDAELIAGLNDQQAEALLLHALREIGVNLRFGMRPPEAIVARLVRKLRRQDPRPNIERALALLERLCMIQGAPAITLPKVEALLSEFELPSTAIAEIRAILDLLEAHGVPVERLELDFGLGRGLNYYTGLIFEIYDAEDVQLCGGGRYDDLVTTLGGRQATPAIGFAYGLERVVASVKNKERPAARDVLVIAQNDRSYSAALAAAQALRKQGWIVQLDLRGRSASLNLRDAERRGISAALLVGPADDDLLWRDLKTREEHRIRLEEVTG